MDCDMQATLLTIGYSEEGQSTPPLTHDRVPPGRTLYPGERPRRPRADRPAARRSAAPPPGPALRRPRPVRRLARADGAGRSRAGAVGRACTRGSSSTFRSRSVRPSCCSASWFWCSGSRCGRSRGSAPSPTPSRSDFAADGTLALLDLVDLPDALAFEVALMVGGVLLCGFATALYIGAQLGRGPRDGLMTGLVRRTGMSIRLVRTGLEVGVVLVGLVLGGGLGVGTVPVRADHRSDRPGSDAGLPDRPADEARSRA